MLGSGVRIPYAPPEKSTASAVLFSMKFVPDGTSEICLRHMKYATRMKCASHIKERILFHILPGGKIFHNPKDYFILRSNISFHMLYLLQLSGGVLDERE